MHITHRIAANASFVRGRSQRTASDMLSAHLVA